MVKPAPFNLILLFAALLCAASCSTTRIIPEGESRLVSNKVNVTNSKDYNSHDLQPYIKQKPNTSFIFGWNPFISIYNWSGGEGSGWDRFVEKVGQKPVVLDTAMIESSKENMLNHLTYNGYYNSSVADSVVTSRRKSTVYYNVTLGERYMIDSVCYNIGNRQIRELFLADTSNSTIKKGTVLSENLLEAETKRLADYFNNLGYYTFSKNNVFFSADTIRRGGTALLELNILDYSRNEGEPSGEKLKRYRFGEVYISSDRSRFNLFNMRRRADSVSSETAVDTAKFKNVNIIFSGKSVVNRMLMNRMNLIRKDSLYSAKAVSNTYNRYSNLGIFSGVNIQLQEVDSNIVKTDIKLTSSALQGYKVNLEMSSNSSGLLGISPAISYFHKNLFRGGEIFSLSFMGDFQFKFNDDVRSTEFGVSTSLSIPNFIFFPDDWFKSVNIPRTEFSLSYNYQDRPEYERNIISASFGYAWSSRERLFLRVNPVQVSIVKLFNLSDSFYESLEDPFLKNSYQDHFNLGFGTNLYYTTDASTNPERSYFYLRWQNDVAGNFLSLFNGAFKSDADGNKLIWNSPYSQYFRTELTAVYTYRFGRQNNQALAFRVLAGYGRGYGNSISLPFEKLFWAGGAYSLRAWQARGVGPGDSPVDNSFSILNQTGDVRFEANAEYRFPLFWSFEGAAFLDVGNVWNRMDFDDFYRHLAANWGFGLRLNLGFALLRLDCGLKIYDPAAHLWSGPGRWFKKDNYGIQFGVGYPF